MKIFLPLVCAVMLVASTAWCADGTLVVCDDVADPLTLDPHRQFSEKNHTLVRQIYDGLVRFDADGNIEPALAVRWERLDPVRMRFHLRHDVVFHNGEQFNAEAARFSIMRYFDPAIQFPAAAFLASIARVEVVDEHTIEIVTEHPDGLLLNRLAAFVLIVPPKYIAEKGADALHSHPVGTGAFRFEEWKQSERIVLSANQSYWMSGFPKVERLIFRFAPLEKQVEMLLSGEADLVTELPGTMTRLVEESPKTRIIKQRTFWTVGATMRTDRGPLADVRVRRALNLAINADDLVRFDSMGNGSVLASLTMPGQGGHNPDLERYAHNVDAARALMKEAGVQTPLVLRTLVRAQSERTARILAVQLAKIGVQIDIKAVFSDADVIRGLQAEEWDLAIAGLPDPMCHSFFIQSILLASQSPFSLQRDPAFDQKLIAVVMELDDEKREAAGRELDAYVHENALSLFTYQKIKTYGRSADLNFRPHISGMPHFFDVDFAVPQRAEVPVDGP